MKKLLFFILILLLILIFSCEGFIEAQYRSKKMKAENNLKTIQEALNSYYIDYQKYPYVTTNIITLVNKLKEPKNYFTFYYDKKLKSITSDPFFKDELLIYHIINNNDFILLSKGPNKQMDINFQDISSINDKEELIKYLKYHSYDPTNGLMTSLGDIIFSNLYEYDR